MINERVKNLISEYIDFDVAKLSLNPPKEFAEDKALVIEQINSRQKAKKKLKFLYENRHIIFPNSISIEQSSSEQTAQFKKDYFPKGKLFADLTGGFGIDFIYLLQNFEKGIFVEKDNELCKIAEYNFKELGINNFEIINSNADEFINNNREEFDLIYIDPSRRSPSGKKIISISESEPNIICMQEKLIYASNNVLIKLSPMINVRLIERELINIKEIIALQSNNELKEILVLLNRKYESGILYKAAFADRNKIYTAIVDKSKIELSIIMDYIYEPAACVQKLGYYDFLEFDISNLFRLGANTNLFTSDSLLNSYFGNVYRVIKVINYNKKEYILENMPKKINIKMRNFPDNANQICKKLSIKEGGEHFLFAYRDINNKPKLCFAELIT